MLKSFFILLFSVTLLISDTNIDKGDLAYAKQNYLKAITHYKDAYNNGNKKARLKLIMTYIKLGDNFYRIGNYNKAKNYYKGAAKLKSKIAKQKIGKVYEKEADQYLRIKNYKTSLKLYKLALANGNSKVRSKISKVKKAIAHQDKLKNDTRKLVSSKSPNWTKSIGRLIIPTKLDFVSKTRYKTKQKKCSATVVNFDNYSKSKVIITASHCLTSYNKDAGDIRFIIKSRSGDMIQRFAKVHYDSNYSSKKLKTHSDLAILVLDGFIDRKDVKPLLIDNRSYLKLKNDYEYSYGSMAGFSSDVGEFGARLTFDPKCQLNYFDRVYGKSNCKGFKGASGGPVVMTTSNDNIKVKHHFVGVVSHFRNNRFEKIFFAPHHIFYKKIKRIIEKHNR